MTALGTAHSRRRNGQFGTGYSKEMLYELVRLVVTTIDSIDPISVSQPRFDREAPAIAKAQGWAEPPTARAICMRLAKGWQKIKEEATEDRDIQQVLARAEGGEMAPWLDERNIHFALRRVALYLGVETLVPHEYERGRMELIAKTKRAVKESQIEELLPTRGQLLWLLEGRWEDGLRIAGMPIPAPKKARGHDLLKLIEHYYETEEKLPTAITQVRMHATKLGISSPRRGIMPLDELIDELIIDRAKRGLPTPDTGPVVGARLTPEEIKALIAGAPKPQTPKNYWTKERTVEAFADFVEMFEGKEKLTLALYGGHYSKNRWPGNPAWQKHGRFQEMVELGRKRARARRRNAA